jgi:5'-deoxynucleotidase YfbR-like HD superfamily hydrolase
MKAINQMTENLSPDLKSRIRDRWEDYTFGKSYEARVVKALDKIEAQIQRNESRNKVWLNCEKDAAMHRLDEYCDFDDFLVSLKKMVRNESKEIMRKANIK